MHSGLVMAVGLRILKLAQDLRRLVADEGVLIGLADVSQDGPRTDQLVCADVRPSLHAAAAATAPKQEVGTRRREIERHADAGALSVESRLC